MCATEPRRVLDGGGELACQVYDGRIGRVQEAGALKPVLSLLP